MGESYFACAEREALEETGLVVKADKFVAVTNDIFSPEKHYITIFVLCRMVEEGREPVVRWFWNQRFKLGILYSTEYTLANVSQRQVMEPQKCLCWEWKSWADVRALIAECHGQSKVFLPIVNLLKDHPDIETLTEANCNR